MHWADIYAEKLLKRGKEHVIETGTSISGIPHIGNASDVIRGDAIRKALEERNAKVRFIWVADDSDPFRKIPKGLENLKEYLGFPVIAIPDPYGCHDNFVEHFVSKFIAELESFGIDVEKYSATELYRSGKFYQLIKIAIENSSKIVEILNRFRKEPLPRDTILWKPVCESCGKIATTKAYKVDGDLVYYKCEDAIVSGTEVKGCGYEGISDLKEGKGKLPWRVEWAMRWAYFKVTCEPLGKEHASAGGSFWTSQLISKEIFCHEPPLPVIYEFFTLNGEKISSSKGNVITLSDWINVAEPEVLKFFMYKKLNKQRDINLSKIPAITDEYDEAELIYFGKKSGSKELARMYELAQINTPKFLGIPFTLCAVLSQIVPDLSLEKIVEKLEKLGYRDFDLSRLEKRLKVAKTWNSLYGPPHLKFSLLSDEEFKKLKSSLKEKLSEAQIEVLKKISELLERKEPTAEELHREIYRISRELNCKPSDAFKAIYLVLINKTEGPKAASFILSLDKNFVISRFKELS